MAELNRIRLWKRQGVKSTAAQLQALVLLGHGAEMANPGDVTLEILRKGSSHGQGARFRFAGNSSWWRS